jgi:hypothetical protein
MGKIIRESSLNRAQFRERKDIELSLIKAFEVHLPAMDGIESG